MKMKHSTLLFSYFLLCILSVNFQNNKISRTHKLLSERENLYFLSIIECNSQFMHCNQLISITSNLAEGLPSTHLTSDTWMT